MTRARARSQLRHRLGEKALDARVRLVIQRLVHPTDGRDDLPVGTVLPPSDQILGDRQEALCRVLGELVGQVDPTVRHVRIR